MSSAVIVAVRSVVVAVAAFWSAAVTLPKAAVGRSPVVVVSLPVGRVDGGPRGDEALLLLLVDSSPEGDMLVGSFMSPPRPMMPVGPSEASAHHDPFAHAPQGNNKQSGCISLSSAVRRSRRACAPRIRPSWPPLPRSDPEVEALPVGLPISFDVNVVRSR